MIYAVWIWGFIIHYSSWENERVTWKAQLKHMHVCLCLCAGQCGTNDTLLLPASLSYTQYFSALRSAKHWAQSTGSTKSTTPFVKRWDTNCCVETSRLQWLYDKGTHRVNLQCAETSKVCWSCCGADWKANPGLMGAERSGILFFKSKGCQRLSVRWLSDVFFPWNTPHTGKKSWASIT